LCRLSWAVEAQVGEDRLVEKRRREERKERQQRLATSRRLMYGTMSVTRPEECKI